VIAQNEKLRMNITGEKALLAFLALTLSSVVSPDTLLINDATLLSPGSPHHGQVRDVLVRAGRIEEIAPEINPQGSARVIEAQGQFLTPGLIDGHVHLYHATGLRRRYTDDFDRLYDAYMAQQPRSYLFHGFTTVVELNADAEANARFADAPVAPDILHCGTGVVLADGFMALDFDPETFSDRFPAYLHDPWGGDVLLDGDRADDHTPAAVIDHIVSEGGQCVKLYYEEALWWPGGAPDFSLPSPQILRELVAEAHHRDLPVFLHATTPAGVEAGLEADIDIFAHGPWEWPREGFGATEPSPEINNLAMRLADADAALQPTIRTIRNTQSLFDPTVLDDPAWRDVVTADYLDYLRSDAQQQRALFLDMFGSLLSEQAPGRDVAQLQANFVSRYQRLVADVAGMGGTLSFGTDTAVGGFGWGAPPGLAGYWEMLDWVSAGIDEETVFISATSGNARRLGMADRAGRVAVGLEADLLLLDADPLEDIRAFDAIDLIIVDGEVIERETLSARALPD